MQRLSEVLVYSVLKHIDTSILHKQYITRRVPVQRAAAVERDEIPYP